MKGKPGALPQYKLLSNSWYFDEIESAIGKDLMAVLYDHLADLNKTTVDALLPLLNRPPFDDIFPIGPNLPLAGHLGLLAPLRYLATAGRTFEVDDALSHMLSLIDIGDNAPGSAFILPYPSIYLHFPQGVNLPIRDYQDLNAKPNLSGVYITEVYDVDFERESRNLLLEPGPCRSFELVFFSEGKPEEPLDSSFMHYRMVIPDAWQDDPISTIVQRQMNVVEQLGLNSDKNDTAGYHAMLLDLVSHCIKVLFFISCDSVLLEQANSFTETTARLDRVGPGKKAKVKKQLARAYDKIIIRPKYDSNEEQNDYREANSTTRSVESHWRRGHFRMQAYGKGRKLRRVKLIKPMFIKGGKGINATSKTYVVKK